MMNDDTYRLHARLDRITEQVQNAVNGLNQRQTMTAEFAASLDERLKKLDVTLLATARLVKDLVERGNVKTEPAKAAEDGGDRGMVWGPNGFPNRNAMAVGQPDTQGREGMAGKPHTGQPVGPAVSVAASPPDASLKDLAQQMHEAEEIILAVYNGLAALLVPAAVKRIRAWLTLRNRMTSTR